MENIDACYGIFTSYVAKTVEKRFGNIDFETKGVSIKKYFLQIFLCKKICNKVD